MHAWNSSFRRDKNMAKFVSLSFSLSNLISINYSLDTVEKHKMGRQWKRD